MSTAYQPTHSPRVAMVSDGYLRDGNKYSNNFASGLDEAVQGNPRAEHEASTAHGLMVGGFVVTLTGVAAVGAGFGVWVSGLEKDADGQLHASRSKVGLGLGLGGLVVECIGLALSGSGRAHELDAINIYNDGASVQEPAVRPTAAMPR